MRIAIVRVSIKRKGNPALSEIADANGTPGFLLGLAQRRKQQARENGDNCNDDQHFDQGESDAVQFA